MVRSLRVTMCFNNFYYYVKGNQSRLVGIHGSSAVNWFVEVHIHNNTSYIIIRASARTFHTRLYRVQVPMGLSSGD